MARSSAKLSKLGGNGRSGSPPKPRPSIVHFRVDLPEALVQEYASLAEFMGVEIEDVLHDRLVRCAGHLEDRGLWVAGEELHQLEKLLATNFMGNGEDAEKLIARIRTLLPALHGLDLSDALTPADVERLRLRAEAFGKSFDDYLRQAVVTGVKYETGQL